MNMSFKPLFAALAFTVLAGSAQAAYFDRVDYIATGGYSASTGSNVYSDAAVDLSPATGDVGLLGANTFNAGSGNGGLSHSYAADAFLAFGTANTDLSMSLSQSLQASSSASSWTSASHQQSAFVDLSAVTLRIVGQAGETNGSAVRVSFSGSADALLDFDSVVNDGYLGLGLSVSRGNVVLGEYLWDPQASGQQNVSFEFDGTIGEELTFSSYMLSGVELANASFAASGSPAVLAQAGASLTGSFTLAPVPEPQMFGMLLTGLGIMGWVARRRKLS